MKPTFFFFPDRLDDARISVIGAPYDLNSSRRYGSRYAPDAIREESLYLEDNFRGLPLYDLPVEDMGDAQGRTWNEFGSVLSAMVKEAVSKNSVPLVMGGDHSITPVVVKAIEKEVSVVSIDAHLDFDRELNGNRHSHGTPRRIEAEMLGGDKIHIIGIRSWPEHARDEAESMGVHIHDAFEVREKGIGSVALPEGPVYLTIDIDGIDPAYAPGTGTPEPFGLSPWDVMHIIRSLSGRIVGMDVVEVCPPCDINGMTSTLASRLMAYFISSFFSE